MSEYDFSLLNQYQQQLWDSFNEGICITDREGRVLLLNARYSAITGLSAESMLGRRVEEFVRSGMLDIVLNPEVVRTGRSVTHVQTAATGRKMVLEGVPVLDAQGEVVLCVTSIRDDTVLSDLKVELTRQKELLEALQHIANAASDAGLSHVGRVTGSSRSMRRLEQELHAVVDTDATVLLLGETGVGKDVTARRIHTLGPRCERPYIKVDCGSIPEHLIETELFGYVGGTFSGGSRNGKIGLIEAADGGTLFLDEIAELPLRMQPRLLRFLQDREIVRVGSTSARRVDARVIAATNRDLERAVERGEFRRDLYYRVKVMEIRIPALRERKGDIQALAKAFLAFFNGRYHKNKTFAEDVPAALTRYAWPGNVRELENVIQRAVLTVRGPYVDCRALNLAGASPAGEPTPESFDFEGKSYAAIMDELEKTMLNAALRRYGSITRTAECLGVARSTIFRKVRRYGLTVAEKGTDGKL